MAEAQDHALQATAGRLRAESSAESSAEKLTPLEAALNLSPAAPPDSLPSLRQFLSRHLQQRDPAESGASEAVPLPPAISRPAATEDTEMALEHYSVLLTPFEVFARGERAAANAGHHLNQLDTEMAAGLEHMLPTPSFRFKVMRNRIANELMILEAKLAQYHEIVTPPAGLLAKIESLEQRRDTLKRHDAEIAFRQAAITVPAPVWVRVAKGIQTGAQQAARGLGKALSHTLAACSPLTVARRSNPVQMQLVELNQQLSTLATVLDTELSQSGPGGITDLGDVSSMLRQYEQLSRRGSRLGQVMLNRQGLIDTANNWLQRHIRHWLTYWQG